MAAPATLCEKIGDNFGFMKHVYLPRRAQCTTHRVRPASAMAAQKVRGVLLFARTALL